MSAVPQSLPPESSAIAELNEAALGALRQGQIAEACRTLTRAIEIEPAHRILQGNLAYCLAREGWDHLDRGEIGRARAAFEQGLTLAPADPALLGGLGLTQLRSGDSSRALFLLEEAQRAAPESQAFRLTLAQLYLERDDVDHAITQVEALLVKEPGHAEAQRLLAKLTRERGAEAGYWQDESRHFAIRYRGGETEVRRAVLDGLERAYDRISRELDVAVTEKIAVILSPETVFREVTQVHPWTQALFDGRIRIPVGDRVGGLDQVLAHELTHALVHRLSRGRAPLWLQEGLAQELEGGGQDARLAAVKQIPRGDPLPLDTLDALIRSSEEERVRQGYLLAWSGVRALVERRGMDGVRDLLSRLGRGESWEASFQASFGQPFREFTRDWAASLAKS